MVKDRKRKFGSIEELRSGRYRALYRHDGAKHTSPVTFEDRDAAVVWLRNERRTLDDDPLNWTPPAQRAEAAKPGSTDDLGWVSVP